MINSFYKNKLLTNHLAADIMRTLFKPSIINTAIYFLAMFSSVTFAATQIDVSHQSPAFLQGLIKPYNSTIANVSNGINSGTQLKIMSSATDFNRTSHIRFKQTYRGYTVWGAEVMLHVPHSNSNFSKELLKNADIPLNAFSNGVVFDKLENDLLVPPVNTAIRDSIAERVAQSYLNTLKMTGRIDGLHAETIVYVDSKTNKATWAYKINCTIKNSHGIAAIPVFIVDAQSQTIYQQWDERESSEALVSAGGYGGNGITGKLAYDGTTTNYPSFTVTRIFSYNPLDKDFRGNCYFRNDSIKLVESDFDGEVDYSFPCHSTDSNHNNLYWNDSYMSINGGYSPMNDTLYGLQLVTKFYQDWYGLPVLPLDSNKNPKPLIVKFDLFFPRTNNDELNAYYYPPENSLSVSGGGYGFYPYTSVGVMAHELGHVFTSQHSGLIYHADGAGAMNEAFSDMAVQAMQYYLTGKNDWRIEKEIISDPVQAGCKDEKDCAVRYMDNPPKDEKSYDNVVQAIIYHPDNHFASGVFNKMFYLLATSTHWNTKMAFNVMVQANQYYWLNVGNSKGYKNIVCGVIAASKDLRARDSQYDPASVISALKSVGFKDDGMPSQYPPYDYDLKDCE